MPANFSNLRLKYTHVVPAPIGGTAPPDLELVFNLTSLNFDINQASVGPGTPFTSEMLFELKIEKHDLSNINSLNAMSQALKDHFSYNDGSVVDRVTKMLREKVFVTSFVATIPGSDIIIESLDSLQLDYHNMAAPSDTLFSSDTIQTKVTPVNTGGQELFSFSWEVKVKFHAESDDRNSSVILFPELVEGTSGTAPAPTNGAITFLTSPDDTIDTFNAELRLNYELLFQPTFDFTGSSSQNEVANSIGKAADELTDSIAGLTQSLHSNLSTTFTTRLQPPGNFNTNDLALWILIKKGTEALSFENFDKYMLAIFCGIDPENAENERKYNKQLNRHRSLPFMNIDAYRCVKIASEAFVMVNCMVDEIFTNDDVNDLVGRVPLVDGDFDSNQLNRWWNEYKVKVTGANGETAETIPYLAVIQSKLKDENIKLTPFGPAFSQYIGERGGEEADTCFGILSEKLTHPCFLELIWSYWHEESMMVQGMNAITRRFQNVKAKGVDPLANLEIDPLRPLNNLLWGYIQDEQHRLTVRRRAYEYNHHYGISLKGDAAKNMRFADSRSKFIEAFHRLLNVVSGYYRQADDMTVQPDGFPVLNALKEVHLILSEGAHNQYGDLPSVARAEMLMQQWLLARPEFREFLPTRIMVAYPEAWMDRVSALNNMMSWTKTSPIHFRDLGRFGEQLLLSIRFGNWASINDRKFASNWANYWREQIQGYIHAYRSVTNVDLSLELTRGNGRVDSQQPSFHLLRKLKEQTNGVKAA